jgi:hypothetical protein
MAARKGAEPMSLECRSRRPSSPFDGDAPQYHGWAPDNDQGLSLGRSNARGAILVRTANPGGRHGYDRGAQQRRR